MHPEVNSDYCKGCHLCVHVCPRKVYGKSSRISKRGAVLPDIKHPDKCVNAKKSKGEELSCELCVLSCPDQAIKFVED